MKELPTCMGITFTWMALSHFRVAPDTWSITNLGRFSLSTAAGAMSELWSVGSGKRFEQDTCH